MRRACLLPHQIQPPSTLPAVAAATLLECVRRGLWPNWDAANPESCQIAERLGYSFAGSYDSYYHTVK